ncbi:MAG: universal stress protein [Burkholderiales bacterium]|nr:universal stress protein [Burkholderiales bacterium]
MFKHILLPTDGSEVAEKAVSAGLDFAKSIGARITGFTALPEYPIPTEGQVMARNVESLADYEKRARTHGEKILASMVSRAQAAGVRIDTDVALSDSPYRAIIAAAQKHGCDLVFMASHGRSGISELLHGSQAHGVLAHSKIPALVYR